MRIRAASSSAGFGRVFRLLASDLIPYSSAFSVGSQVLRFSIFVWDVRGQPCGRPLPPSMARDAESNKEPCAEHGANLQQAAAEARSMLLILHFGRHSLAKCFNSFSPRMQVCNNYLSTTTCAAPSANMSLAPTQHSAINTLVPNHSRRYCARDNMPLSAGILMYVAVQTA